MSIIRKISITLATVLTFCQTILAAEIQALKEIRADAPSYAAILAFNRALGKVLREPARLFLQTNATKLQPYVTSIVDKLFFK